MSALRSAENSCSTTARRDTTTLLRFWSSLMTLNSSGLFSRYDVSRTGRTSTSEPGRNARTFSISTVKPPLTRPVMTPVTICELLKAVSRRVQVRARLAFSRDRRVSPVPSSTESSATSTSSPVLTSISPRSFLNWSIGDHGLGLEAHVDDDDVVGDFDDEPREDHAGADALVSETVFEELGETFCHTFTSRGARGWRATHACTGLDSLEPRQLMKTGLAFLAGRLENRSLMSTRRDDAVGRVSARASVGVRSPARDRPPARW